MTIGGDHLLQPVVMAKFLSPETPVSLRIGVCANQKRYTSNVRPENRATLYVLGKVSERFTKRHNADQPTRMKAIKCGAVIRNSSPKQVRKV